MFTEFAHKCAMFECIFTGFAQNRLWERRVSLLKNAGMSQMSLVFPLTFHLFLFLEAGLGGFERLREAWEGFAGFGRLVLGGIGRI